MSSQPCTYFNLIYHSYQEVLGPNIFCVAYCHYALLQNCRTNSKRHLVTLLQHRQFLKLYLWEQFFRQPPRKLRFGHMEAQYKTLNPRCKSTSATSRQPQYTGVCSQQFWSLIQIWHPLLSFPCACAFIKHLSWLCIKEFLKFYMGTLIFVLQGSIPLTLNKKFRLTVFQLNLEPGAYRPSVLAPRQGRDLGNLQQRPI